MLGQIKLNLYVEQATYALAHMTSLPISAPRNVSSKLINHSLLLHPLLGFALALVLSLVQLLAVAIYAPMVAAIVLGLWFWLTSSVHISGYLSTVNSFLENNSRINIPSNQNWTNTAAVVILMLVKFTALMQAANSLDFGALVVACVLARTVVVGLLNFSGYDPTTKYGGLDEIAISQKFNYICIAVATVIVILFGLLWAIAVIAICCALALIIYWRLKVNNSKLTGDQCNALVEGMEAIALWIAVI